MKILFLQKRMLFPADCGGRIRTLHILRYLARWHQITYLCNLQAGEEQYLSVMKDLGVRLETVAWKETPKESLRFYWDLLANCFTRYPFTVTKDYDPALRRRAMELLAEQAYDLLICDFVQMARNCLRINGVPKLLFQHNVEAEIFKRHAEQGPGWLRRRYMSLQWHKMKRFESRAGRAFDAVIAVSDRDREMFQRDYGWRHVRTIDTAVDAEYFQPNGRVEKGGRVVFVGSMDWLPNQDGVRQFVQTTWPFVRHVHPQATFQIVGRNPSPALLRLTGRNGVEVVGTVPDVRPYLAEAAVVAVPLLVGGGTRLKIYEAMAMGKAIVSTSLGAEGLPVTDGKHLRLADTPAAFAEAIAELLACPCARAELGQAARQLVSTNYSAETIARQFDQICQSVGMRDGTR